MKKKLAIVGATGSVGGAVLPALGEKYYQEVWMGSVSFTPDVEPETDSYTTLELVAICAYQNEKSLKSLQNTYQLPDHQCFLLKNEGQKEKLMDFLANGEVELVVLACSGSAGKDYLLACLKNPRIKKILTANKESLVMLGHFLQDHIKDKKIIPLDSEHACIYECLYHCQDIYKTSYTSRASSLAVLTPLQKITLTTSGGPFYELYKKNDTKSLEGLDIQTFKAQYQHPTYPSMGLKISIDSATMANKALELIEAHILFAASYENLAVVRDGTSRVHSMVTDGFGITHMLIDEPDMATTCARMLALSLGARVVNTPTQAKKAPFTAPLTLEPLHINESHQNPSFQLVYLAFELIKKDEAFKKHSKALGSDLFITFNAVNEELVQAFTSGYIEFLDIIEGNLAIMHAHKPQALKNPQDIDIFDKNARILAQNHIKSLTKKAQIP